MTRSSSLFAVALSLTLGAAAITGCASEAVGEDIESGDDAMTVGRMIGDFHLHTRTLDEAFLFDGAVSELRIVASGDDCTYQAFQAKGGCDADTTCTDDDLLSSDKHRAKISGSCTVTASKLTLKTPNGELSFKVATGTASHGVTGFVLTSTQKLSRAGKSAFFAKTSSDPGDALGRAYSGGADQALTKDIKSDDPSLSAAVRAGLKDIESELDISEPDDDFSSEVTAVFAVYASPFDDKPVAYAVEGTSSGDHCGGFHVIAVDANGKRIKTELQDGDC